jgi:hypothetical protein
VRRSPTGRPVFRPSFGVASFFFWMAFAFNLGLILIVLFVAAHFIAKYW